MVKINGKEIDAAGKVLADFLTEEGYELTRIAVERNEDIVPKAQYSSTVLEDNDVVEVVMFVSGG